MPIIGHPVEMARSMTLQIFSRVHLAQRAAEDREVLAEDADLAPRDLAVAGDDPVPQGLVLLQPEVVGSVHPVTVQLDEGAVVEQQLDALAGRQLAAFALLLDGLSRGPGALRRPAGFSRPSIFPAVVSSPSLSVCIAAGILARAKFPIVRRGGARNSRMESR